jgi:predicted MFS family arabinose efflux permease
VRERLREASGALRAALSNPSIRRLQLAFAGSSTGQWACSTAVTVFSFQAGGAAAVSLQLVLRMVPAALAAPVISTLADRYARVRVMVVSDCVRVAAVTGMGVLVLTEAPFVLVLVLSGISGVAATAFEPAKAALLPALAKRPEELTAANVVSSSIDSVSFFAGPAIGGLLLAATSTQTVLWFTAATFVWSALLVSRIPERARERAATAAATGIAAEVAEGIAAVRGDPRMRLILAFFAAQTFVDGALTVLLVATAIDLLDLGEAGLGLLSSAVGIGGLVGVAASATLAGRSRLAPAFAAGMALWGLPLIALGLLPGTVMAVAALATTGVANTLGDVSGTTLLQRAAPEDVTARVFGLLETIILGCVALGSVVAGATLGAVGIEAGLVITGAILPVMLVLRWRAVRALDAVASPEDVALLQRVDIFAPLGPVELERLAEALVPVHAAAGEVVVRQGEHGDRFLLIVAGTAGVSVDGAVVRQEGPGDYFGEIALLRDTPRTATVTALEPLELRALRRDAFLAAVTGDSGSAAAAEAVAGGRLATARPLAVAG